MPFLLPGDIAVENFTTPLKISSGLRHEGDQIIAEQCGSLKSKNDTRILQSNPARYIPTTHDLVIGVVTDRLNENFRVEIGYSEYATLPYSEFESISKKNRPDIPIGGLVYCRVSLAGCNVEIELSCLSPQNKPEGFGHLIGGYLVDVSIPFARELLKSKSTLLDSIAGIIKYEIAIGVNGKLWINTDNPQNTVFLACLLRKLSNVKSSARQAVIQEALSAFS
ncbi:hypothetical protein RCL1_001595 [Eukaryota sp. TZLM3-RCL]